MHESTAIVIALFIELWQQNTLWQIQYWFLPRFHFHITEM